MSDVVISVEGLSKRYRLGLIGRTALHEDLSRWWARLRGQPDPTLRIDQVQRLEAKKKQASKLQDDAEHIWALRDINFEVKQGEVLGIIGKNGAGKSTLLKILSRVTSPTLGCVKVKGRIASLLEVGTGFHPELTGRENIFLNGAILGMTKSEVRSKFDEIVSFSGIDAFVDTPVKRYSSGMYVRLAFSVAAHLDPEILVVDEVLAVGDAEFQKKCLGRLGDVANEGRTVLFVSHNMAAVENICTRAIVLSNATVSFDGSAADSVGQYLANGQVCMMPLEDLTGHTGSGTLRVNGISLRDAEGNYVSVAATGADLDICLHYDIVAAGQVGEVVVALRVENVKGVSVFQHYSSLDGKKFTDIPSRGSFIFRVPHLPLPPSHYSVTYAVLGNGETLDSVSNATTFTVRPGRFFKTLELPSARASAFLVNGDWRLESRP